MSEIRRYMLLASMGLGTIAVFYLSWLPNPDIGLLPIFPAWLGKWTNANGNLRTAVPFVALGGLGELIYVEPPQPLRKRLWVVACLTGIVLLAEIGQLFLPRRHFDGGDIAWGMAGTLAGIGLGFLLRSCVPKLRNNA